MIKISDNITISDSDIELKAVRSQGAGGQNVNKVATAIHLRFDIQKSTLPNEIKEKLFLMKDKRITSEGVIILKAQKYRTQEKNREEALNRLIGIINKALVTRKKRVATKPAKEAKQKRLDEKSKRSEIKNLRKKVI